MQQPVFYSKNEVTFYVHAEERKDIQKDPAFPAFCRAVDDPFVMFVIVPFIYGLYLTMTNWDGFSSTKEFVGLRNYANIFKEKDFWSSIWLTFRYVIASVVFVNGIAFLLAYLLTSGIKGENFLRAGFFTPNLIGGIVLGFIWQFIFNRVLTTLPIFPEQSFLSDPIRAFWAMVIVETWRASGYMLLIYIAGFVGVPRIISRRQGSTARTTARSCGGSGCP